MSRVGFEIEPFETAGGTQKREVAILNERQATSLITYMRNSEVVLAFKDRLVDAFFQLVEQQRRATAPTFTLKQALRQALESEEAREVAEQARLAAEQARDVFEQKVVTLSNKVQIMQTKVKTLDAIAVNEEQSMSIRDAANTLNIPQNEFVRLCIENNILYRAGDGTLKPHATVLDKGWFTYKIVICADERQRQQTVVTQKGIIRLAEYKWKSKKRKNDDWDEDDNFITRLLANEL